jgi:hypothetical protein
MYTILLTLILYVVVFQRSILNSYLHSNIKSHQSNQTRSRTLRNLIGCQYSYYFWHSMTYNTCIFIMCIAIKLKKYYRPLCQCSNLISFRINDIVLSGMLVQSISMKISSCWINISLWHRYTITVNQVIVVTVTCSACNIFLIWFV